jgi:hypothetical protein
MRFLKLAPPVKLQRNVVHVDGLARAHLAEKRFEFGPCLCPDFARWPPQAIRMLVPCNRDERIVVEPGLIGSPRDEHWLAGGQHQVDERP